MSKPVKISDEVFSRLNDYCGEVKKKSVVASKAIEKYLDEKEAQEKS